MYVTLPSLRRSRHPLLHVLSLLVGVAVLGALLVFGLLVAGVLLVGGSLLLGWRAWRLRHAPTQAAAPRGHQPDVLEGEFVVVRQDRPVAH